MRNIAIIDYQMCNLFSVQQAFKHLGANVEITSDPNHVLSADGVVLPGVGAFKDAVENMRRLGLDDAVIEVIKRGKPFLGICLGFQMLFDESEEFGVHKGLGIFRGSVKQFPSECKGRKLKVPQIGWNQITKTKNVSALKNINDDTDFYFVHSFYVAPEDPTLTATMTEYNGFEYCSSIEQANVFACQFHPEKSSVKGIQILDNWLKTIN